jgi:formate-nitrite transporter family protein
MEKSSPENQAELSTPELDDREHDEAEKRVAVSALIVHEAVRKEGDEELDRPAQALAWSGLAAGLSMGASLIVEGLLQTYLPNAHWRPLLVKLGYPFGFLMVVLGRQQLFTENTLTVILPLMARRNWETFWKVCKLWTVVLIANLAGAHVIAWALSNTDAFKPDVRHAFNEIAREAVAVGFGTALLRGIFAGWLIAMMVWMLAAVRSGQIMVIVILTYAVGLGNFTHIIAGSVEALFLVWAGELKWWAFLGGYAVPTLIGNILGGVSLVSALNHAQVIAGHENRK